MEISAACIAGVTVGFEFKKDGIDDYFFLYLGIFAICICW